MENIKEVDIESVVDKTITTYVIIDRGNGEYTSMLKETYDAQQAEHLNGSIDA